MFLLIAGGLYLEYQKRGGESLLNNKFNLNPSENNEQNNASESKEPKFTNQGPAPELTGLTKWINSEPLKLESLKGKVVLVDFWTYSCINCIRTLPYVTKWYDQYKDQNFVVLGIHTPEFAFEKVASNVETAIKRYNINYPVALDNNYKTWSAFNNQFWPAHYLIDKNGDIVYTHFGEGQYEQTEKAIRTLIGLEGEFNSPVSPELNQANSPEIYLGSARLKNFGGTETPSEQEQIFVFPKNLKKDRFAFEGKWRFKEEAAEHTSGFGRIRLNFSAAKVFMVAQSNEPTTLKIYIDGKLQKGVTISNSDLYPLFEAPSSANHTMEIEFPKGGVEVFTFTFG